jgi:hypothetical protein
VQVNTMNSDAVEAEGTSKILVTSGENCFVGNIHFGNVLPPKNPSCTFLKDPFANKTIPASSVTCTFKNLIVKANGTILSPGTYCGNTILNADNIKLNPGVYVFRNGGLQVQDATVIATNVAFVLTGTDPSIAVVGTSVLKQTPPAAGSLFAGFSIYLDSAAKLSSCETGDGKKALPSSGTMGGKAAKWPVKCQSGVYDSARYETSGTLYLANAALAVRDTGKLTIEQGSIISFLLLTSDTAALDLTAEKLSSASPAALRKYSEALVEAHLVQ